MNLDEDEKLDSIAEEEAKKHSEFHYPGHNLYEEFEMRKVFCLCNFKDGFLKGYKMSNKDNLEEITILKNKLNDAKKLINLWYNSDNSGSFSDGFDLVTQTEKFLNS